MNKIADTINLAINDGVFPGVSLLVNHKGNCVLELINGLAQLEPVKKPLTKNSFFDIASLTKIVSTATLMMMAVDDGECVLNESVSSFFPNIKAQNIQIRHLLNHTSGYQAWHPYHEYLLDKNPQIIGTLDAKKWILNEILKEDPINPLGEKVVYSDLNYILLGCLLEKIYSLKLENIFKEKIAKPLGLTQTFFNLIASFNDPLDSNPDLFVATEDCTWRNKVLNGEVMDGTAYSMGGSAGHAGLFSTAKDLEKWFLELRKVELNESDFIKKQTFETFTVIPQTRNLNKNYFTYGFDTVSQNSSAGKYLGKQSIGHLGYTGCSFWWDLEKDFCVILLTNRVHPTRKNDKIREFRPLIHNLIVESLNLNRNEK